MGEKNGLFDSAILIAVVTLIGYYLAYSYKKGYFYYYGLTENIISKVDIITIIVASTSLLTVLLTLFAAYVHLGNLFNKLIGTVPNPVFIILKKNVMPLIILWFLLVNIISDLILIWSIGALVLIAWIYINPIFSYYSTKGYINKLKKFNESNEGNGLIKKINKLHDLKLHIQYILLILLVFSLGNVVAIVGVEEAKKERSYLTVDVDNETYIVLDVVGESYLITPYDEKKNSIKPKFSIVEVKSELDDLLEVETVRLNDSLIVEK